jgi:hypothetical protein
MCIGYNFQGINGQGMALAIHTQIAPGLKKEYSTPPVGLDGLFYGELYFLP